MSSTISARLYSFNDGGDQADKGIDNVDLVLGGDHGQGVFRALFKVIIRDQNKVIIDSFVVKVGHIDCKKDTYEVLKNTIAPDLDNDLKELKLGEKKFLIFRKLVNGKYHHTAQVGTHDTNTPAAPLPIF